MEVLLGSLACTLANIATTIMRYIPFSKIVTKKQKLLLVTIHIAMLFIFFGFNLVLGFVLKMPVTFYKSIFILYDFTLMLANIFIIKKRTREHLFTCGLAEIIILTIFTVETYVVNMLKIENTVTLYALNALFMVVMFIALFPLIKKQLVGTITPFLSIESNIYWKNIWLIPYVMFYASFIVVPNDTYVNNISMLINRVLVTVATIFICRNIADNYKRIEENQAMQSQYNMQKEYYSVLSEKVAQQRKARHDFKHHISAINHFCETDNKSGLMEYCSELWQSQSSAIDIPYTGNGAVDGVLYNYSLEAKENNISFNISGIFESNGITDIDLCVLLGNAIDNAITGCMKVEKDRFIEIQSKTTGNVLVISVSNSFDGVIIEKKGKIYSRKGKDRVGVGLLSIKTICEKYGGSLQINHDEKTFSMMMLLNKNIKD